MHSPLINRRCVFLDWGVMLQQLFFETDCVRAGLAVTPCHVRGCRSSLLENYSVPRQCLCSLPLVCVSYQISQVRWFCVYYQSGLQHVLYTNLLRALLVDVNFALAHIITIVKNNEVTISWCNICGYTVHCAVRQTPWKWVAQQRLITLWGLHF
jgi:hypothetical protein